MNSWRNQKRGIHSAIRRPSREPRSSRHESAHYLPRKDQSRFTSAATVQRFNARNFVSGKSHLGSGINLAINTGTLNALLKAMIRGLMQTNRRLETRTHQQRWERRFAQLEAFKRRFGHCFVPILWPENKPLGPWVGTQRSAKRAGRLNSERIRRLNGIGFPWAGLNPTRRPCQLFWDAMFQELSDWKTRHGHFRIPRTTHSRLPAWIDRQRTARWRGLLRADRLERLSAIGFPWEPDDPLWEQRFAQLGALQEKCDFTFRWPKDAALERWSRAQRVSRCRGQLSQERIRRLDKIGFRWTKNHYRGPGAQGHWEAMFEALQDFHRQSGHFWVTEDPPSRPGLRRWALHQREYRRHGILRENRFQRLNEVGFPWGLQENPRWEQRYAELAAYKQRCGHCNVPSHWSQNKTLGLWVMNQRLAKRLGRSSPEHIIKLNELGFEWRS